MRLLTFLATFFLTAPAMADELAQPWQMGFQKPASPLMERLSHMHDALTVLIIIIALFVLGLLAYVCTRFSAKNNPTPSKTTHNTLVEVIWTVVPIIILVSIAIPSLRNHYFMNVIPKAEMTLKVVGNQWYWHYEYPDNGGFGFDSYMLKGDDLKASGKPRLLGVDNPVFLPVDTVIRVQVTGADVIHSWAMPVMGVKSDAIPGKLNEAWFKATREGVFYGQCSELCGVDHGFMPIELHVVSKEAFAAWVEAAKLKFASDSIPTKNLSSLRGGEADAASQSGLLRFARNDKN